MKKLITILLAVAMMATLSVTAFAAESELNNDKKTETIDVKAKYTSGVTDAGTIYSVDLSWESMEFTYSASGKNTWNPDTHKYEVVDEGGAWNHSTSTITVTNHSNAEVTAKFTFAPVAGGTVTGSFNNTSVVLPSAENKATDATELTGTSTFTIGGSVDSAQTEFAKVGTITVTIE
ncbi:MAG: hypothetical protein IJ009_06175 [Clostridia bacterium]|nr:hypothetical protein [Clostridia bacterium]